MSSIILKMSIVLCLSKGWWTHPPPHAWMIQEVACEHHINPLVVSAIIKTESDFDPLALVREKKVRDWSVGLMQIRYQTAKNLGYGGSRYDLFNRRTNLEYGIRYLLSVASRYRGNFYDSISAYNAGRSCRCNRQYVMKVLKSYYQLE